MACTKAKEQLAGLYDKALNEVGEDNAAIFEIHQMMLEDEDYLDAAKGIIDTQAGLYYPPRFQQQPYGNPGSYYEHPYPHWR